MTSVSSIIVSNSSVFEQGSIRPEIYSVAASSYSTALHGCGADLIFSYKGVTIAGSELKYTKLGKTVIVEGYIVLDIDQDEPSGTSPTEEIRIHGMFPSTGQPLRWGKQLPLPAHPTISAGTEAVAVGAITGGSQPLFNIQCYDELDNRVDGCIVEEEEGTGPIKARILADGSLAIIEEKITNNNIAPVVVEPFRNVALTVQRFNSLIASAGGWGEGGTEFRLVITGQYLAV